MSIAWSTVQAAIQNLVQSATGLGDSVVRWAGQGGERPAGDFVDLWVASVRRRGMDWLRLEDNDGGGDGEEVVHYIRGPREAVVRIRHFGGAVGDGMAISRLNKIKSHYRLPSQLALLEAAGVGVLSFTPVAAIEGVLGAVDFEPRAETRMTISLAEEISEVGTFIDRVEITNTIEEPDHTFTTDVVP